jgi:hypothetical protein
MRRKALERRSKKYAPVQNVSVENWYMDAGEFRRKHMGGVRVEHMPTDAAGKNRITIFGPSGDGSYVVEFRTAQGETLAIPIPRTETAVIRHFQERMPHGLFVPELD